VGQNSSPNTGILTTELVYDLVETSATNPTICTNCVFTFDITATFLASQSTDLDGEGEDITFSYALGTNAYGASTLFYGSNSSGWVDFIVDGEERIDLAGTVHAAPVTFDGTNFSYAQNFVDYYYTTQ